MRLCWFVAMLLSGVFWTIFLNVFLCIYTPCETRWCLKRVVGSIPGLEPVSVEFRCSLLIL